MKIENIVNGENFKDLADIVIDANSIGEKRDYASKSVVFCKTDFLDVFFAETRSFKGSLALISHQSDYSIDKTFFEKKPDCVKKWFAQNTDYQHENLIPIPIGIENHKGPSRGSCIDESFILNELDELKEYTKSNSIYVNFADTHPDRLNKRNALKNNPRADFSLPKKYGEYFKDLARRKYTASPRGNGIDCHRTWEALLVGSIPIVDRHFMYDDWNIPVIQVNDWANMGEMKVPKDSSIDVLHMSFWAEKLNKWRRFES